MADEEAVLVDGKPVDELKVIDLKRECDKRGLSKLGSKTALADRLKAQLLLEKLQTQAKVSPRSDDEAHVPNQALQNDEIAGQNDFIKQYLARQQKSLQMQMEVKKKIEEEKKHREESTTADESSADETHLAGKPEVISPDVTSKEVKAVGNAPAASETAMGRKRSLSKSSDKNEKALKVQKDADSNGKNADMKKARKSRSRSRSGSEERSRSRSRSLSSR